MRMMDDDVIMDPLPSSKSITPPVSLTSTNSSDNSINSVTCESDEVATQPTKAQMLQRMFCLPVANVCKTEECKHLMIYIRRLSQNIVVGSNCADFSHIDNDKCIEFFRNYIVFLTNCGQNFLKNISQRPYINFLRFSMALWNFTDKFESTCVRMSAFEVHIHLIRFLGKLKVPSRMLKSRPIYTLVLTVVGILHNINNTLQYTRSQYRDENLIAYLTPFAALDTTKELIGLKTAALLMLAFLVNENENSSLNAKDNHIIYILDILRQTLNSPDHYSTYYGYHSLEILNGLRRIASPDLNKLSLINNGVLSLIEIVLSPVRDCNNQDEVVAVLELLWSLSFSKGCLEAFHADGCNLKSRIEVLSQCDNRSIVLCTSGILWNIEAQRTVDIQKMIRNDAKTPNVNGYVMISYNHRTQETMVRIKEALEFNGYTVWMDVDHMKGCFVDAMAEGIKEASVLVLGMCQAFKDSPHCRQEVKYAYTLGIPFVPILLEKGFIPDGWLGLVCATLIYTEFTEPSKFNKSISQLQTQLGSLGKDCNQLLPSKSLSDNTCQVIKSRVNSDEESYQVVISPHHMDDNIRQPVSNKLISITSDHKGSLNLYDTCDTGKESNQIYRIDSNLSVVKCCDDCDQQRLKVLDWTLTQCQSWLSENNINPETHGYPITDIDGPLLFELAEMRISAPQSYFFAVKNELKFNFIDNLRLSQALRRLDEGP